jgi:hypothetical protein
MSARKGDLMKNIKWPIAVLAFVLTLVIAVGLVQLRQRQLVNEPLFKRVSEYEAVKTVDLQQEGNMQIVKVDLGYVDDLAIVHRELNEEIEELLGHDRFSLIIQDERNETLEAAYIAVHLALFEGEQRGNFTEMGELVVDKLQEMNMDEYRVLVDQDNIYLQIRQNEAYLYEIIVRESRGREGEHA